MSTYDDLIIGGLLGGDQDRYKRARSEIQPVHLVGTHRALYDMALRYFLTTGYPVDWPRFQDILTSGNVTADRRLTLESEFGRLWHMEVQEGHYRYALKEVRNVRRDEALTTGLSEALRTMMGQGPKGAAGYEEARARLSQALTEIDRWYLPDSPEGNIRDDYLETLADYENAKRSGGLDPRGVRTGIREVDERIINLRPGENMLVAGYSSHGKTTVLQNIAWNATVVQAKNVLVLTNENQYAQYRSRIYNRHTHWRPGEVGQPGGIRMNDLKTGSLTGEQELIWHRVANDFGTNPAYGKLVVVQMPTGASVEWAMSQAERWGDEMPTDLLILDYIGRCGPITKRPNRRDELNDSINAWKSFLVGYRKGYGIPGITGYQTSREKMAAAQINGYYDLTCLAETSEAERNADVVMSGLRMDDVERELIAQLLKNRDGATLEPTPLEVDFATTFVGSGAATWRR